MKTKTFQTLDVKIPHGKFVPADNVMMITTETFNSMAMNKLNRLRFIKAWETLIHIIGTEEISFDKIHVDITEDYVLLSGDYNYEKAVRIEITKAPIS